MNRIIQNINKGVKGEKGSSLLGALLMILVAAFLGAATINLAATEIGASSNEMESARAFYTGQAGLEYAKFQLSEGYNPTISNKDMGDGSFTITTDPVSRLVTSVGVSGKAVKTHNITTNFSKDCVSLDTATAYSEGKELKDVKLVKTCNGASHVDRMWIEWNWHTCVVNAPTNTPESVLEKCPVDTGGAVVKAIALESTTIYNPGLGIGTPGGGGADPGEEINVEDYTLTSNGTSIFQGPPQDIRFSKGHPGQGLYKITVQFADGSRISDTFRDPTTLTKKYQVQSGKITVNPRQKVSMKILGSAITYGARGPEVSVMVEMGTKATRNFGYARLFGNRDVDGGEEYTTNSNNGFTYTVRATAMYSCRFYAKYDSTNTLQVKTLVNGDHAPALKGFGGQKPVTAFLAPYLDTTGKMVLNSNQVIMLFELGVNMRFFPNSPAADFQDLVVLFTIGD